MKTWTWNKGTENFPDIKEMFIDDKNYLVFHFIKIERFFLLPLRNVSLWSPTKYTYSEAYILYVLE